MPHQTQDPSFQMTRHARQRICQRGIDLSALDVVLLHGADYPAGSGLTKRMLHHSQLAGLGEEGVGYRLLEKAFRIEAVLGPEEQLITCYTRTAPRLAKSGKRSRRRTRSAPWRLA